MLKTFDFQTKTLIAFAFFMPWSRLLNVNTVFIVFLLLFFFKSIYHKSITWSLKDTSLSLVVFFFTVFITAFYSKDINMGLFEVRVWLFLLIPVGLYSKDRISKTEFKAIAKSFIAGMSLALLYLILYAIIVYKDNPLPILKGFVHFTAPLKMHPSYFSLYLIFNVVLIQELYLKKSKYSKVYKYLVWILLISIVFFIRSRVPIVISLIILLLSILANTNKYLKYILIAILALIIAFNWSVILSFISHGRDLPRALDERLGSWKATIEVIKNHWLFGVGVGDYQTELDKQYFLTGFDTGIDMKFNSHNQYLQIFASSGILSVFSFLSVLFFLFRNKIKQKSFVIMSFVIIVSIQMFFESILIMLHGVYFFTFFATILLKLDTYEEK